MGLNLIARTGGGGGGDLPTVEAYTLVTSFGAGWDNYEIENDPLAAAGFYKDPWGRVFLEGVIANEAEANGTVLTLPAGYRPAEDRYVIVAKDVSSVTVTITAGGVVQASGLEDAHVWNFDVSFRAA